MPARTVTPRLVILVLFAAACAGSEPTGIDDGSGTPVPVVVDTAGNGR